MAKWASVAEEDAALNYIAASDVMTVCSAQPTTYTEATVTFMLASVSMAGGDFTIAADSNGEKVTMAAKTGVSITNSGTATHIALCKVGDTTLRVITTCTSQALTSGGTVDIPSWKWNIQQPT